MGLSSFKLLVGDYGAGKTHFLYVLREIAWRSNFAVSLVKLSPSSCPFDKLELVYKNLCSEIAPPPKDEETISYTEFTSSKGTVYSIVGDSNSYTDYNNNDAHPDCKFREYT